MRAAGFVTLIGGEAAELCSRNLVLSLKLPFSHLGGGPSSVEGLKDIVMLIFLSRNQDPVSRLYHYLIVSPLFLDPLPSLISNCLNPPFQTQGRSRRLNEAYILQARNVWRTQN